MDSLLKEELPEIVSSGAFGKNVEYVSFELDKKYVAEDQYMSTVLFGTVNTSEEIKYNVLIKLKPRDEKLLVKMKIDLQFENEVIMYEKIIPFLFECHRSLNGVEDWPSLARYFYGRNKCGEFSERDLIMLENVVPLGFRLSEERLFLDYDHLVFALRALAKFHGLSYTAKHNDLDSFQKVITDLRDTQFTADKEWILLNNQLRIFGKRGVDRLIERSGDIYRDNENFQRLNEIIYDGDNALKRTVNCREPFSIVCHGDFNRNNVLFRYDDVGLPVDVLIFDFGTPRYGSPALDISFLLYMNTTQNMRESRWDDLLNEYCSTLAKSVPSVVRVPNRNELNSEMAACAFFGFAIAMFFLPYQLDPPPKNMELSVEEEIELMLQLGGDQGTDLVADLVQHIVDMGYTNV